MNDNQKSRKVMFSIIRNERTNELYPRFGEELHLAGHEVLAYRDYSDGTGHFQEGYHPNTICLDISQLDITGPADALPYRLGSIIHEARMEAARKGQSIDVTTDIKEVDDVDDVEYETKGDQWILDYTIGIWMQDN